MNVAKKMLLKHILDDNYSYPIILSGMEKITLPACVFLPANIDERQLFTHSDWNKKLDFAAQNEKTMFRAKTTHPNRCGQTTDVCPDRL